MTMRKKRMAGREDLDQIIGLELASDLEPCYSEMIPQVGGRDRVDDLEQAEDLELVDDREQVGDFELVVDLEQIEGLEMDGDLGLASDIESYYAEMMPQVAGRDRLDDLEQVEDLERVDDLELVAGLELVGGQRPDQKREG